jgi:DnaK suppressor protein
MEQEKLKYFQDLLTGRLTDLVKESEKTVSGMTTSKEGNFPDPTDRASLETDRSYLLRLKDRERKLVFKVQEALKRIDAGTFGICESCGGDISIKRLEVRPVTTYCIECKKNEEALEKAHGL